MNDIPKPRERENYYREAGSWAEDQASANRKSQRRAWLIASCACVIALCEAIALVAVTPLKTVVPYTLLVDRQTGYVQALAPLDAQKITPDNALTQSFLVQYVIAREGFNIATMQASYRKTALWSADAARRDYLTLMQISNPASPLIQYPRTTTVEPFVKSVSPLAGNKALIRFALRRRDAGGQSRLLGNWVAVISYRYSSAPLSLEDRFINPLGFQVLSYRKNQEALPSLDVSANTGDTADQRPLTNTLAASRYPVTVPQDVGPAGAISSGQR